MDVAQRVKENAADHLNFISSLSEWQKEQQQSSDSKPLPNKQSLLLKEKGNAYVAKQRYKEAIHCYSKALALPDAPPILLLNRSLALLKIDQNARAEQVFILEFQHVQDCSDFIKHSQSNPKAFWRRFMARKAMGKLKSAREDLRMALVLEPANPLFKQAMTIGDPKDYLEGVERRRREQKGKSSTVSSKGDTLLKEVQSTRTAVNEMTEVRSTGSSHQAKEVMSSDRGLMKQVHSARISKPIKEVESSEIGLMDKVQTKQPSKATSKSASSEGGLVNEVQTKQPSKIASESASSESGLMNKIQTKRPSKSDSGSVQVVPAPTKHYSVDLTKPLEAKKMVELVEPLEAAPTKEIEVLADSAAPHVPGIIECDAPNLHQRSFDPETPPVPTSMIQFTETLNRLSRDPAHQTVLSAYILVCARLVFNHQSIPPSRFASLFQNELSEVYVLLVVCALSDRFSRDASAETVRHVIAVLKGVSACARFSVAVMFAKGAKLRDAVSRIRAVVERVGDSDGIAVVKLYE